MTFLAKYYYTGKDNDGTVNGMLHVKQQNQTDNNTKENKKFVIIIINGTSGLTFYLLASTQISQTAAQQNVTVSYNINFKSSRLAISFP